MKINKRYNFKLEPTQDQHINLRKMCGCVRFVYNYFLKNNMDQYAIDKTFVFYNEMANELPELKEEFKFLQEAFSQSLQTSLRNLSTAFTRFFKGESEFPVFKKKGINNSFTCPQKFRIEERVIFIPKIGEVRYRKSRQMIGKVKSITVKEHCGRWSVSILIEQEITLPENKKEKAVGVDVGLKEFATLSNNDEPIANPKYYRKYQRRLAKEQRKLSHKVKFSNSWYKQLRKLQNIHYKIYNCRLDFLHKITTQLIKNHDIIALEDLNVKGMMKNRRLSKSIADAAWGIFKKLLKSKANHTNKIIVEVERFYPSSKKCAKCGYEKLMPLHLRTYQCGNEECNHIADRDWNAAVNILNRGLEILGLPILVV